MDNIRVVEVQDNADVMRKGTLYCKFPETTGLTQVIYTTPYLAPGGEGGFYAIPEEGSQVMVCKPADAESWYYMSTVCNDHPATILGDNSLIRSHCILYAGSEFGSKFSTGHRVTIREFTKFGKSCRVGTVSDIQGYSTFGNHCFSRVLGLLFALKTLPT